MPKSKTTILLIENDSYIQKAYSDSLTRAGFEVLVARDGAEGLALAQDLKPGLILLDIILPGKNGLEVLKELKRKRKTRRIPVIMTTVSGHIADVQQAGQLGAAGYFPKHDTGIGEIVKKINQVLEANRPEKR